MSRPYIASLLLLACLLCGLSDNALAQSHGQYPPWYETEEKQDIDDTRASALPDVNDRDFDRALNKAPDTEEPSALEKMYANRLIDEPKQFGYDLFNQDDDQTNTLNAPMGAVQDNFVLSTGDELLITFTGQRTDQSTYKIDTSGMIIIKDIAPIPAMGRTIKQLRESLDAQLSSMPNTQSYVSLSAVRQIGVLVVGHVKKPGRKTLNAFHSVLDALDYAGGIKKDGSLRRVKLVRGGRSTIIDLYALLLHGAPHIDMDLKDGDRLIVPPIGPTVAISGAVKRPGIYEIRRITKGINQHMHQNSEKLNLNAMLDLAGGVLTPGQNRFVLLSPENQGQESVTEIQDSFKKVFANGAILSVLSGTAKRRGTVELVGHTSRPGLYDLSRHKTLTSLLKDQDILGQDIYPLIGVIERWDTDQLTTKYLTFPIRSVLQKEFDLELDDNDVIKLVSNTDISDIYDDKSNDPKNSEKYEEGSRELDNSISDDEALISFLKEQSVSVRGAVRKPGSYPIAQGITLDHIIAVAGGLTLEANKDSIELTSQNIDGNNDNGRVIKSKRTTISLNETMPENYTLSAGDSIRVNQKFQKIDENTVLIIGEVKHPGEYDLLPGDRVSDLINRAGNLTTQAYPEGSIFSRESERRVEEMQFRNDARALESALAKALQREKNQPNATQIELVRSLADKLSEAQAVGRITVETDPDILSIKPELDMLLEKGDRIYVPKRPLTVRVSGEVLSPSSLQFISEKDPLDYIHEAGGFTFHADKDRTFVLYPDGSAQPLQVSSWNHRPVFIPPGSTIIIPRDPEPFSFIQSAKEVGQILSNLAVTSVFIDDIRD